MKYILLLLILSSCTTFRVGDKISYKNSWNEAPNPINNRGTYFIQGRILAKSNGWIQYKFNVFENDSSILFDRKRDFRRYWIKYK